MKAKEVSVRTSIVSALLYLSLGRITRLFDCFN